MPTIARTLPGLAPPASHPADRTDIDRRPAGRAAIAQPPVDGIHPDNCLPAAAGPRRRWLRQAGGLCLVLQCQPLWALAEAPTLEAKVREWAGGQPVRTGRVVLVLPELVENGNAVPMSVRVDSAMTAQDRVREIVVFNERNPQREVLRCAFGPASPRAEAATRIRLATSQRLVALARMADGSQWQHAVDVVVTLAACIET